VDLDFGLWMAEREGELTGKAVDFVATSIIILTNVGIYKTAEQLTKEPLRVSCISFIMPVRLCNSVPVSRDFCSSPCN
jgi:hypothetical protein